MSLFVTPQVFLVLESRGEFVCNHIDTSHCLLNGLERNLNSVIAGKNTLKEKKIACFLKIACALP